MRRGVIEGYSSDSRRASNLRLTSVPLHCILLGLSSFASAGLEVADSNIVLQHHNNQGDVIPKKNHKRTKHNMDKTEEKIEEICTSISSVSAKYNT